jgi:hypothetical protein
VAVIAVEYGTPLIPVGGDVDVTSGGADSVRISAPKFVPSPAATQFAELEHDTVSSKCTPLGTLCGIQLRPPSLVVKMLGPPTALHASTSTHEMEESVAPTDPRSFHCVPPSDVPITCEPTAKHVVALTHAIPLSVLMPAGGV